MRKESDQALARHLAPLLEKLVAAAPATAQEWTDWIVKPIPGGANNLLYRASGAAGDFAVKFTIRDSRERAKREFCALQIIAETGLEIAPQPILIDTESYPQPVVVQSWIDGEVQVTPPTADHDWLKLLEHHVAIHSIEPAVVKSRHLRAVIDARSIAECHRLIETQLNRLPEPERPGHLRELIARFYRKCDSFTGWNTAPVSLCRVDCNTLNFIRRSTTWASVDWENSGWGDGAFELADIMTHPAYMDVPHERWAWMVDTYSQLVNDSSISNRVHIYYQTLLVWWNIRWLRYRYEMPRGLDQRLAKTPTTWDQKAQHKYEHYQRLADRFV